MPKNERQRAAWEFQFGDEVNIIIGVVSALGTGLTLTRAQFMILVEEIGDPGEWEQAEGRIMRRGNLNWDGINIFELYSENVAAERAVRLRRQGREKFANSLDEKELTLAAQAERDAEVIEDDTEDED